VSAEVSFLSTHFGKEVNERQIITSATRWERTVVITGRIEYALGAETELSPLLYFDHHQRITECGQQRGYKRSEAQPSDKCISRVQPSLGDSTTVKITCHETPTLEDHCDRLWCAEG